MSEVIVDQGRALISWHMSPVIALHPPILYAAVSAACCWFDDSLICATVLQRIVIKVFILTSPISNIAPLISMVYKSMTNILLHRCLSKWIAILTTDCERIAHAMVIRLSWILGIFGT